MAVQLSARPCCTTTTATISRAGQQALLEDYHAGQQVSLYAIHGYCRTCAKVPTTHTAIGTMTLGLSRPEHTDLPSGDNTISVAGGLLGSMSFQRSNTALRLYSLPSGQ